MGIDPAMMQTVMQHLQGAFAGGGDEGISWDLAKRQALHIANQDGLGVTDGPAHRPRSGVSHWRRCG
jgi:hypothetical protein